MSKIADLQEALQLVLTTSATEHGDTSGWHQRQGQISASQFVQTVSFGFLEHPHATLGQLARVACTLGAAVTPQAISQRFTRKSVALMRGVVMDALGILLEADPVEVDWLQRFPGGVYLNDSTQITWHADWATTWDGGATAAALKIPTLIDLLHGSLQADLVPARQHDSATRLANLDFPAGSVVVEDSGYLDSERMRAAGLRGYTPSSRIAAIWWCSMNKGAVWMCCSGSSSILAPVRTGEFAGKAAGIA